MCSTRQSSQCIWDRRKKGQSAAVVSVDPWIPMAGVAQWPSLIVCTVCVPTQKCTHVRLLLNATEIQTLELRNRRRHKWFPHWSVPLAPIFPADICCTKSGSGGLYEHSYYRSWSRLSGEPGEGNENLISAFQHRRAFGTKVDTDTKPVYVFLRL